MVNPYSHIEAFLRLCSRRLLKTLWQKKKSLKTSHFSFWHNVFNSNQWVCLQLGRVSILFFRRFQSRLLHVFCLWERINEKHHLHLGMHFSWFEHHLFQLKTEKYFMNKRQRRCWSTCWPMSPQRFKPQLPRLWLSWKRTLPVETVLDIVM